MKRLPVIALAGLAASAAVAQPRPWHLTPEGYGPARIGMTRPEVERALSVRLTGEPLDDASVCIEMNTRGRALPNMYFMFENRRLSRIAIDRASRVTTPRGIGVGATAAQVRRAYPTGLQAEEHAYTGAPAEYLTFWTVRDRRGVRFTTDERRRVDTIIAGNQAIRYIEGCA